MNEFIRERKPPYMVPAVTIQIDSILLNQNQKVNKKALPKPQRQNIEVIPPQNDVQQKIFDCIAEVVGHTEFGITTNIYEAGLSSIGAIKLNVLLSKAFDTAVTSRDLKENNTIDKLETFLTGAASGAEKFEVQPDYGLTKTQEGVYVECIAKPTDTVYNIPLLLEISDDIDTAKLKTAIVSAVNAHPILKTRLFLNDDGDVRMRRMDGDFSFDENSITERDISSIDEEKANLVKPFKLLGGRLFRVELLHGGKTWLFIEMHHIISDGSSAAIILNDISAAYEGRQLETETYSGFEVVLNEEKLRASEAYGRAKNYYEKLLDGAETQSLPVGDIIGGHQPETCMYEMYAADIDAAETKAWCENNKASMNGLLSAAFGLTLNKYLGTESAVFAGIYSGRNDSRLAGTVAMLVKTLPIVVNIGSGKTTAQLAREVSEQLVDSQSNDIYSFAEICRAQNVNADVMFAWQGDEFTFDSLCGKPAKLIPLALSEAKAPMNLNVFIDGGKIRFSMEYRGDRYSEAYIRGFLSALESALTGMVRGEWLNKVSLMYKEARRMLDSFNATTVEIPNTTCNRLFEEQVKLHPDKTAVIAGNESLTYTQLNESANRIANALNSQGTRPDDMVGVMMPREVWAYAVREGVLKAGGAYMPLAPDYPDDRVEYIITNSGSKTLVTNNAIASERKDLFLRLGVNVCTVEELLKHSNTNDPDSGVTPENLCYCIYTSGSTGKPKGVMIEHHSLVNFVNHNPVNLQSCEFVDNMTVSLALAALTFDVSVLEETLGLYHGGTVAIATEEEINNPLLLCEMMRKNGVDVMKCTPSYMNNLLDFEKTWDVLRQMKAIDIGAEAFPAPLYDKMRAAGITAKIHNGYGPTETTITASMDLLTDNRITIGKPLCNTKIVMLDKFDNELPPDVPGELTIVGECVGRGYVANEKLTAEKFIVWHGAPAYRSGDMARWGRNRKINFIGRADNQVKLRGLRIELDEIENVMNTYPSVLRSVVLVKTSEKGEQFLCAWFAANEPVDHSELKAHLAKSLAKYMIPSVFVQLDAIPLTQNGKVDKKALPEPGLSKERETKKASTALQKQIAEMFTKALGTDHVGIDEDFFEIGGTSLLASKVAMQAMVAGLPIAYKDIFTFPTVEALERKIVGSGANGTEEKPAQKSGQSVGEDKEIPEVKPALEYNTMEHVREVTAEPLGDILLTGATGFLGIHMLRELIENERGKITCLIRKGSSETARKRLESMLVYYFDTNYGAEFDSGRLKAVDGDITDRELVLAQDGISFGTVINCAACVKHFAKDDILDRVNVKGVENLVALCEKTGSRLIQISTVSVAGENVDHALPDTTVMRENMLYFGQDLSNQYVRSKYNAEELVLREVAAGKLKAKIMRVGNLMSRDSDGEFQVNSVTSGFMRNLKGYAAIGAYPVSEMARPVEFSPIDLVARAVRLLSGTPDKFTVFHAVNGHWIEMGDVIAAMKKAGITVDTVDEEEFSKRMSEAMQDEKKNMLVSGLISYLSSDAETVRTYIPEDHTFTKNALYRLGYRWQLTDEHYLESTIQQNIAHAEAERLLRIAIDDEIRDITGRMENEFIAITEMLSDELNESPEENMDAFLSWYGVSEVNILNADGIIVRTTNPDMVGYDLNSEPLMREFMSRLSKNGEAVTSMNGSGDNDDFVLEYIGVLLGDGNYVLVGFSMGITGTNISYIIDSFTSNRHVLENGLLFIIDGNNTIVSKPFGVHSEELSRLLEANEIHGESGNMSTVVFNDSIYYRMYDTIGRYKIIAAIPKAEIMENIRVNIIMSAVLGVVLFVTLFVSVSMLVKRKVSRPVKEIAETLASITGGELNEKVSVRSSSEFDTISNGINMTVDALKDHIAREAAKIDEELRYAREIQYSALPVLTGALKSNQYFNLFASMNTAKEVGGDFYDFYMINEYTLVFIIADVSGKGIPAAMFMMKGKATLRDSIVRSDSLGNSISRANGRICDGNEAGMFITAWVGILDIRTGRLSFVNAGHNPPVLIRDGKAEFLKMNTDLILGAMDDAEYQTQSIQLREGDILYLYTDGVTEAIAADNSFYGNQRLIDTLNGIPDSEDNICEKVCGRVSESVGTFADGAPQADDITMLCLHYKGRN